MSRRKSVASLQQQLKYAEARAAYKPPVREEGAATERRPKIGVKYICTSPMAAANLAYTVQASQAAITFISLAILGLTEAATDPAPPRGFKPAKINATVAGTPQFLHALGSGRGYTRYGKGERGSKTQYNYSAPVSGETAAALKTNVTAAFNELKSKLGGQYGRAWFTPEVLPESVSGL